MDVVIKMTRLQRVFKLEQNLRSWICYIHLHVEPSKHFYPEFSRKPKTAPEPICASNMFSKPWNKVCHRLYVIFIPKYVTLYNLSVHVLTRACLLWLLYVTQMLRDFIVNMFLLFLKNQIDGQTIRNLK